MTELEVHELKALHPEFQDDVVSFRSFETSVESRDAEGSTSKRAVLEQVAKLRDWLQKQ